MQRANARAILLNLGASRQPRPRESGAARSILFCLDAIYRPAASLDLYNQILISKREMSGTFFSGCLRECARNAVIRLVLSLTGTFRDSPRATLMKCQAA